MASVAATAEANGLGDRIQVIRDDAADSIADGSVDLVVCNPPFHVGAAVVTTAADLLFAAAARVLRPGGELWTVYNSAPALQAHAGQARRADAGRPADAEVHSHGVHPPLTPCGPCPTRPR